MVEDVVDVDSINSFVVEFEVKEFAYIIYRNVILNIDSNDRLITSLCDKRDDFDFAIVNISFLYSNLPLSPAYGVNISQLIQYARACCAYEDFSKRGKLLKKMVQGYNESRLKSSFCQLYSRYNDLVCD
jgi:hypothetical protein